MSALKRTSSIRWLVRPFIWLGMNPLAIFIAMIFVEIFLLVWIAPPWVTSIYHDDTPVSLWTWIFWNGFNSWIGNPHFSSLAVSLFYLVLWTGVAGLMFRYKIFVKL